MRVGLPSRLDRRRQRQKGSVAAEFAIVGGWLIVVLGAIIETGIFLIVQFNLQNAAETAGRKIRTNQVQSTATLSDFKTEICAGIAIAERGEFGFRHAGMLATGDRGVNRCGTAACLDIKQPFA